MDQRLSVVTLGVADLDRARRFYEEGLGWQRGNTGDEIVFFQLNGLVFSLFPREHLARDARVQSDGSGFRAVTLGYCARSKQEVDHVLGQAEKSGARIVKAAQMVFWGGYAGYFADPDDHLWEVAWNPQWTLSDDGNVSLQSS